MVNEKKIKKLSVSMEFDNYPKICKFLGQKVLEGNMKIIQMKEWERYFKWEKRGQKFIITEIYSEAKEKEDNRGIYKKRVEKLILDLLCQENILIKKRMFGTLNQILESIYAINHNYIKGQIDSEFINELISVDVKYIDEFYNITYPNFKNMIETTLNSLENKGLILWRKHKFVAVIENGEEIHREATDDEMSVIVDCLNLTLKEMKLDDLYQVYTKRRVKEFRTKITKHFTKNSNILYYYNSYGIFFSSGVTEYRDKLEKTVEKYMLEYDKKMDLCLQLNEIIYNEIIKNAKKREKTFLKNNTITHNGENFVFADDIKGSGVYSENIKTISDTLIKTQKS